LKESNSLSRELEFCINNLKSRVDARIIAFNVQPEIKEKEIILRGQGACDSP